MKDDLISRQAAIELHCELCLDNDKCICEYCQDVKAFECLPTAEPSATLMKLKVDAEYVKKAMQDAELTLLPAEPRKGKWVNVFVDGLGFNGLMFECSECGKRSAGRTNFCAYCGARMEETETWLI